LKISRTLIQRGSMALAQRLLSEGGRIGSEGRKAGIYSGKKEGKTEDKANDDASYSTSRNQK